MTSAHAQRIEVVDSHTGGEPTRVVVRGGPDLGHGTMAERMAVFRERNDSLRSAVVNEPRGSDAVVGALLADPVDSDCAAGVIFFNNVGYLGMCVHGTIGVVATLSHLGRIGPGVHRLETPVGVVSALLEPSGEVTVVNVPSYRLATDVAIDVPGHGPLAGDVAWGGNWFFLVNEHGQQIELSNVEQLVDFTWRIRLALREQGVTGADGQEIDHIELFVPSSRDDVDSKNFVLCPGKAYDRSPCGTGTSAKLACLFADGKLAPGERWRQEGITGSVFEGFVEEAAYGASHGAQHTAGPCVLPHVRGTAFVNAEATLILDPRDPFRSGIRG